MTKDNEALANLIRFGTDVATGEVNLVAPGSRKNEIIHLLERVAALQTRLAEALAIMKSAPFLEPDDWKQLASVIGKDETLAYVQALRAHSAKIKAFEESLKK